MNFREMAKPSPVPSIFFAAAPTCRNSSNTRVEILGRDADARVGHRDLDRAVAHTGPHVDAAAFRRELQRVRQQVEQHLLHLALVAADLADALVDLRPSVMPRRCARSRTSVTRVVDGARQRRNRSGPAPSARPRSSTGRGCR